MAGFNKYYYIERVFRGKSEASEISLKDFLDTFFARCHIDYNPHEKEIIETWRELTGNIITQFTKRVYCKKGDLYVEVTSPAVKAELLMVNTALKDKINEKIGKNVINKIVIR